MHLDCCDRGQLYPPVLAKFTGQCWAFEDEYVTKNGCEGFIYTPEKNVPDDAIPDDDIPDDSMGDEYVQVQEFAEGPDDSGFTLLHLDKVYTTMSADHESSP